MRHKHSLAIGLLVVAAACSDNTTAPVAPNGLSLSRHAEQEQDEALDRATAHPTIEAMGKLRAGRAAGGATTVSNLTYHGGTGGIGVATAPKIYLVVWGSQWNNNDPQGEIAILQSFFSGVGGSGWLNSVTQYCNGVAVGTVACPAGSAFAGNQAGMYAGIWYDNAAKAPSRPSQSAFASEAVKAAAHFGNTSASVNTNAQYVIATATGNSSSGFKTQYCAYHSSTSSSYGNVAYTNLPYLTDAGASCGANFNGLGPKAGITIVEGHELGETISDQFPSTGWLDASGAENGDKCAWIGTGSVGASANFTFSTGTFPVQSLWSNKTSNCAITFP